MAASMPQDGRQAAQDAPPPGGPVTGFPPRDGTASTAQGRVTLAVSGGLSALHVPPLDGDGETVVITAEGTEVDPETARRAHEAAQAAGFTLTET